LIFDSNFNMLNSFIFIEISLSIQCIAAKEVTMLYDAEENCVIYTNFITINFYLLVLASFTDILSY